MHLCEQFPTCECQQPPFANQSGNSYFIFYRLIEDRESLTGRYACVTEACHDWTKECEYFLAADGFDFYLGLVESIIFY